MLSANKVQTDLETKVIEETNGNAVKPFISACSLKGNSRLILTIFCIDVNIGWINFTAIIDIDDE